MRRDAILAAVGRKIPDTRVVDQDEDDVGLVGGVDRSKESREKQGEGELHGRSIKTPEAK